MSRIRFTTDRLLKFTCPEGKDRVYVFDDKTLGLSLCVTATGQRTFYLRRRINGRSTRIRLGIFPDELSVDDARNEAAKHNGDIAKGVNPQEAKRLARGRMTFGELWQKFLDLRVVKRRPRTQHEYQRQYKRYLSAWKNKPIAEIDTDAVSTLHVRLGANNGHYISNRVLALISAMFRAAKLPNPAQGVEKFPEQERERYLLADEVPRFFQALEAEPALFRDFFKLALLTGARRSNLQAMRWQDINGGIWTVPGQFSKNGKPLTIHLTGDAIEILKARLAEANGSPFVFSSYGKTGHLSEPKTAWKRICERAGLKDLRPHDLRRSLGSWLAKSNVSMRIIQDVLGHRSPQSTKVYARIAEHQPIAAAVEIATAALLAAANGKDPTNGPKQEAHG